MIKLTTPISREEINKLKVGDRITISGSIYTGRDAVLPKVVKLADEDRLKEAGIDLEGNVMFHTAVSPAGVGPTSSNKLDIEGSMEVLSREGIRIHLGKGALKKETAEMLRDNDSVYAVIPPVTALLKSKTLSQEVAAFPEEGMEALHRLEVVEFPAVIAIAGGKSIYDK